MSLPPLSRAPSPALSDGFGRQTPSGKNSSLDTVPTRNWRSISPNLQRTEPLPSISKGTGGDHLKQALSLAVTIARRYKAEGKTPSAEEKSMLQDLVNLLQPGGFAGGGGGAGVGGNGTSPTSTPKAAEASKTKKELRSKELFGMLKKATTAQNLYQQMVTSKGDVASLTEFALKCAALVDASDICSLLQKELESADKVAKFTILVVDPIEEHVFMNPLDGTFFPDVSLAQVVAADGAIFQAQVKGHTRSCIPIRVDDEVLGVAVGIEDPSLSNQALLTTSMEDPSKRLLAIVGIAALSLKNWRLYDSVRWQVEKAEAMLRMATQLSRDNLQEDILVNSIIETARTLTESDRCSVFLVKGENLHAYFGDGNSVKMPLNTGIAGYVATSGKTVNIVDAYKDPRFNSAVDKATGYRTKTILCLPVRYEESIVAVAQLVNKRPSKGLQRTFTTRDEDLFATFSTMIGICLRNCRVNDELGREREKTELLLSAAAQMSESDIRDINGTVGRVIHGAKTLLGADRATIFLIDKEHAELYSKLADDTGGKEIRFPMDKGIAGSVAVSGLPENIPDAYKDTRFNQQVDLDLGYRTQSILCQPIVCRGDVLAVAQLVNKLNPRDGSIESFTSQDEKSFTQFATFAGIALSNAQLLKFAISAGEEALTLNQNMNHATGDNTMRKASSLRAPPTVSSLILEAVKKQTISDDVLQLAKTPQFSLFNFRDEYGESASDAAILLITKLIMSTGLPAKFDCDEDTLLRFVCQCRRRYRKVPYHNFFHVVDACQTLYTFLYHGGALEMMSELEAFTLLITGLAHDLDHMGLNNSFHMKTDSPLGILSSASGNTSVLEVHHCNVAVEILEDPFSNVFGGLSPADTATAYRTMIDTILATDMAKHADYLNSLKSLVNGYDAEDPAQRKLVIQMLMKCADISNVTKPFDTSRLWAIAVTEEFYQQGDKEKERGVEVAAMFDRSKAGELANGQIGFINFIARKFFEAAVSVTPGMKWALDQLESNVNQWKEIQAAHAQKAAA